MAARVNLLSIQSQVVYGHVGNAAAMPALHRLGFTVWALPTAILSHHPGHGRPAGRPLPAPEISVLANALAERGLLAACDGLLTGWLGGADTAEAVLALRQRLRRDNPAAPWLCDPVIGDLPKGVYVQPDLVAAFRDRLLPMADIATPNGFELELLSGRSARTLADTLAACRVLLDRGTNCVVCTSLLRQDGRPDGIEALAMTAEGAWLAWTPRLNGVPQGAGDLFAALFLGAMLRKGIVKKALARAVAGTYGILRAGAEHPLDRRLRAMDVDRGQQPMALEMRLIPALSEVERPSHDPWIERVA